MGFLDKAKKLAGRAGPMLDKAAPHARTAVDKAGQQIDKRTGGKYHDQIEQAGEAVVDYADKRVAADGTGSAGSGRRLPAHSASGCHPSGRHPALGHHAATGRRRPQPRRPGRTPPAATPPADDAGTSGTTAPPAAGPDQPGDGPTR